MTLPPPLFQGNEERQKSPARASNESIICLTYEVIHYVSLLLNLTHSLW